MKNYSKLAQSYLFLLAGTFIASIGINLIAIHNLTFGGVSGLAIVIEYFTGIPLSIMNMVINIPLFLLGMRLVGGKFLLRSIFSTSMLSVFLWCTSFVRFFHTDLIITSVFGGILLGIGVGIVIKAGGSTGGTDMLALVLHEKLHLPVGPCMFITDSLIILLGAFTFGINKALYAILVVFFISRSVTETTTHFDEYINKFLFSFFEKIPPLHNV